VEFGVGYRRPTEDMFANAKAQAWWSLRVLATFRAVNVGKADDPDAIISLNPDARGAARAEERTQSEARTNTTRPARCW